MNPWSILAGLVVVVAGLVAGMWALFGLVATLAICFIVVCLVMMLVVLIQKPKGGGLSGAFGAAGGETAFGAKTGDVLTWVTIACFVAFIGLAMGLTWTIRPLDLEETPAIEAPAAPEQAPAEAGDQTAAPVDLLNTPGPAAEPAAPAAAAPAAEPVPAPAPAPATQE